MNRKLIKTIASLTCGVGCVGVIYGSTSSLSTSKQNITSKTILNTDPFSIDYSPILGHDYKPLPKESFKIEKINGFPMLTGFVNDFNLASYVAKGYDTLILPDLSATGIAKNVFSDGLKGIKNIVSRWCNKIESGCFNNCESLENLVITPESLLVENSFNNCFQLRKIIFFEAGSAPYFAYAAAHDDSFFANAGRDTYEDFDSRTVWSYGEDHTVNEAALNSLFDKTQLPKNWSGAK